MSSVGIIADTRDTDKPDQETKFSLSGPQFYSEAMVMIIQDKLKERYI